MSGSGRLARKVAIVTGGANGIGRAISALFAREGSQVVVVDRDVSAGEQIVKEMRENAGKGEFVAADVSVQADLERAVGLATEFGRLEIVVNCAGIALGGTVVDTEPARWQRVLEVNLAGAYLLCRLAIPRMIEAGGGAIVNVASLQGLYGYPGWAAYAASKAGMIGLTRQIAVDYKQHNIRCNAISPGAILTELGANTVSLEPGFAGESERAIDSEKTQPASAAKSALLRPGRPEDVAFASLFLASDESAHITGQNLIVDGGASARLE